MLLATNSSKLNVWNEHFSPFCCGTLSAQSKLQAPAVVDSGHMYKKKIQRKVAVTHVIASPIQMQSLTEDMELVMLQKEQNVKYFQSRNNLIFYIVDSFKHSSATLKPVLSLTQQRVH